MELISKKWLLKSTVILFLLKEQDLINAWLYDRPLKRRGRYNDIDIYQWGVKRWGSQFTELEFKIRERYNGYN